MEKRVLIICETGISAALFVSKFLEEIRDKNLNIDVDYAQTHKLQTKIRVEDYDALVLTPQVAKYEEDLREIIKQTNCDSEVLYMTKDEYEYQDISSVFERLNTINEEL